MKHSIMHGSGSGSPTELELAQVSASRSRRRHWGLAIAGLLLSAVAAPALDLFTLWQRPELPLNLGAGQWADYRRQALAQGRRTDDLLRIQCLGRDELGRWVLEVLPLVEAPTDVFTVVPGEGLRISLTDAIADRSGGILAAVAEVRLWRDGEVRTLEGQQWRQDPLVTASFSGDFRPDFVEEQSATVRVITGRELTCRQFVFAAADTQVAESPVGRLVQAVSQEVAAAVHADVPLLGLAYVTERLRSESWLDPPSKRRMPPPEVRVEILECIAFGSDARPQLAPFQGRSD